MSWISLEEARERVPGKVEWWHCRGPQGEVVEVKQYDKKGPSDRPVRLWENGEMFIGGYKESRFIGHGSTLHGLGVYYCVDERVIVGHWNRGNKVGLFKQSWLPSGACWMVNETSSSEIKKKRKSAIGAMVAGAGVPYIYIGAYKDNLKNDPSATVILRDGLTRIGPWKTDKPVGDWWDDHTVGSANGDDIMAIIAFEMQSSPKTANVISSARVANKGSGPQRSGLRGKDTNVSDPAVTSRISTSPQAAHESKHVWIGQDTNSGPAAHGVAPTSRILNMSPDPQKLQQRLNTTVTANSAELPGLQSLSLDSDASSASSPPLKRGIQKAILIDKEARDQCIAICTWLETQVIGHNPNKLEMRRYARRFFDIGFHSVRLIQEVCTPADVESFVWMKPIHKRLFLAKAKLKTNASSVADQKCVRFNSSVVAA
jgi:hypothetical protein